MADVMTCLNVGCGPVGSYLHPMFRHYHVVRVDANPAVAPDVLADVRDLSAFDKASVDGVHCWHVLEHLDPWDVPRAVAEFHRVLRRGGLLIVGVPNLEAIAWHILNRGLEVVAYQSPQGPIYPLDMLYGHSKEIQEGNDFMRHRTAFTRHSLARLLERAGFRGSVQAEQYNLLAIAECT